MVNIVIILFLALSSLLLKILITAVKSLESKNRSELKCKKLVISKICMVFLKKIVPRQIKSEQQKTRLLRFLRNHRSATRCIFFFSAKLFFVCVSYIYYDTTQ